MDNVIYECEVPKTVPEVEDLDSLPFQKLVGETEIGHVRPSGGPINGEETQTRGWDVVQLGICMGKKLVALLRGSVQGHRIVHLVLNAVWHLLVRSIHRGR